jgi:hypothetical protein
MKTLLGVLFIIAGIVGAVYLGVWVMFIGGIVDIIEQVKAPEVSAWAVAGGIAKIIFCELAAIIAWIGFFVGGLFMTSAGKKKIIIPLKRR